MVRWSVICMGLALIAGPLAVGQTSRAKVNKGPRAIGLLELLPGGKARLIPVVILIDGEYYDASAYKASPVPMALWSGTVYEGSRSGVSEGLFTVSVALENEQTKQWIGEGTWQTAAALAAKSAKKPASPEPRGLNEDEGPPVLRHAGRDRPKAPEPSPTPSGQGDQKPPAGSTPPPPAPAPASTSSTATTPQEPAPSATSSTTPAAEPEDKDRPTLKRGRQEPRPEEPLTAPTVVAKVAPHSAASLTKPATVAKAGAAEVFPAISDAHTVDLQPYSYNLRADDREQLQSKILAQAADAIRARAKQLAGEMVGTPEPAHRGKAVPARPVQPQFSDVQFRAFDLANSNEPILVLTVGAHLPQKPGDKSSTDAGREYLVTIVARQDINGDLHKVYTNITDSDHLDVLPRVDLIDVVDVDGDGRGELLFRQVSDAGTAFVVYRVIGDQLYPLFQGAPQ